MKKIFNNYYLFISIIIFCILFVILLGFYPGIVTYDSINQWNQVQSRIITDAHPFFSTFFMLILSKIWNSYTSTIIFQIVLIAITWGYLCKTLKAESKKQIKIIYVYSILVFLTPLIALFSITVWKDIIYTSYLMLCAIMLFDWFQCNYQFSNLKYCLLGFILSMIYSYRHNGIIVAILLIIIFYIIIIKKYRKKIINKQNLKRSFLVIVTFIICFVCIGIPKKIILDNSQKKIKNKEVTLSTIDGYMLWMMGAHLQDNNIKGKIDKQFLDKIIPLDEWNELYNPYLINSITLTNNIDKEFLIKNNKKFKNLFIKYSLKHPLTIANHYLKADSLLINPFASFQGYVYVYGYPISGSLPNYTKIKSSIPLIEKAYNKIINISFHKPFILFYQPAILLYLSIIITIILAKKIYGRSIWLFSMPMLLNTISLLPINLAQDLRYVYINYLTFFGLFLILIINLKKIRRKKFTQL